MENTSCSEGYLDGTVHVHVRQEWATADVCIVSKLDFPGCYVSHTKPIAQTVVKRDEDGNPAPPEVRQ